MYCPFKQFKDVFGIPGQGVHRYRFLNAAIFDYLSTIVLSIIFSKVTKIPLVLSTILMFIIGIILHVLFGVNTETVKFLGLVC